MTPLVIWSYPGGFETWVGSIRLVCSTPADLARKLIRHGMPSARACEVRRPGKVTLYGKTLGEVADEHDTAACA